MCNIMLCARISVVIRIALNGSKLYVFVYVLNFDLLKFLDHWINYLNVSRPLKNMDFLPIEKHSKRIL